MSTEAPGHAQATLAQLREAEREGNAVDEKRKGELAAKAWDPSGETRTCGCCGAHVQPATVRVFGGDDGVLHGCQRCLSRSALTSGAGADPKRAARVRDETPEVNRRGEHGDE
jgi:hypothetical protein